MGIANQAYHVAFAACIWDASRRPQAAVTDLADGAAELQPVVKSALSTGVETLWSPAIARFIEPKSGWTETPPGGISASVSVPYDEHLTRHFAASLFEPKGKLKQQFNIARKELKGILSEIDVHGWTAKRKRTLESSGEALSSVVWRVFFEQAEKVKNPPKWKKISELFVAPKSAIRKAVTGLLYRTVRGNKYIRHIFNKEVHVPLVSRPLVALELNASACDKFVSNVPFYKT